LLIIQIVFCFNSKSQNNNQNTIESLKMEYARLENCNNFFSQYKGVVVNHRYEGDKAIVELNANVSSADFVKFLQDYKKNIIDYEQNLKNYSKLTRYHVIYSGREQNNKTVINAFYETAPNNQEDLSTVLPLIKVNDITEAKIKIMQYESQLEDIKKAKKWYQDLSNTLQHQINYNLVETADNAGDLLLKHVEIPQGDVLKEKAMEKLRKKAGVENEKPIKNSVADFVDIALNAVDNIPGGDQLASALLEEYWVAIKSLPEAGKIFGHIPASINIYFRKREYDNKIQEFNNTEQQIRIAIEANKYILKN